MRVRFLISALPLVWLMAWGLTAPGRECSVIGGIMASVTSILPCLSRDSLSISNWYERGVTSWY